MQTTREMASNFGLTLSPGKSMKDGIPSNLFSLQFATIDDAARLIAQCGPNTLQATIDISHTYCNTPGHPKDYRLLGMAWNNSLCLLPDCVESVNPIIYSDLDAECILQAALHTQGAAGLYLALMHMLG